MCSLSNDAIFSDLERVYATSGSTRYWKYWKSLEFNWSSCKFLTDGTTKAFSHKRFSSSPVVWKVVMMLMYISYDDYVYLVNRVTDLSDWHYCRIIVS